MSKLALGRLERSGVAGSGLCRAAPLSLLGKDPFSFTVYRPSGWSRNLEDDASLRISQLQPRHLQRRSSQDWLNVGETMGSGLNKPLSLVEL